MLDRALIDYCSPTLARLKLGSMCTCAIDEGFCGEFQLLRGQLAAKGLTLVTLRVRQGSALVYLYRADELARELQRDDVWRFLRAYGYERRDVQGVVATLKRRMRESEEFPHEIGVFLGYPLSDVIGFIANKGQNCLCCGCWKVYSNACDAMRAFQRFRKCKAVYRQRFASGCPLTQLTVAARTA